MCVQLMHVMMDRNRDSKIDAWALGVAATHGLASIVQHVLDASCAVSATDVHRALLKCSSNGHVDTARRLLHRMPADADDADDDADAANDATATIACAFRVACTAGHAPVVRLLLQDARTDPCERDNEALWRASRHNHVHVVDALLCDGRADPGAVRGRHSPLVIACREGCADVVERLLRDARVDPAVRDFFVYAFERTRTADVVRLLIRDGRADPTIRQNGAIRWAAENAQLDNVDLLLRDARVVLTPRLLGDLAVQLHPSADWDRHLVTMMSGALDDDAAAAALARHTFRDDDHVFVNEVPDRWPDATGVKKTTLRRRVLRRRRECLDTLRWLWRGRGRGVCRGTVCRDVVDTFVRAYTLGSARRSTERDRDHEQTRNACVRTRSSSSHVATRPNQ
jgi:hypothetical protein